MAGWLEVDQAKRMKDLERGNVRLKRLVADLSLEKQILKDDAAGNLYERRPAVASVRACRASTANARVLLLGTTPRNLVPRFFAAASASLVRLLIIRRSSSATMAIMPP